MADVVFPENKEVDPEVVINDESEGTPLQGLDDKLDLVIELLTKQEAALAKIERITDAEI